MITVSKLSIADSAAEAVRVHSRGGKEGQVQAGTVVWLLLVLQIVRG